MNRRAFLSRLGLAAAAAVAAPLLEHVEDPERLLWIPGAKSFFLPHIDDELEIIVGPRGGGNQFLTIEMITREALRVLENNLAFSKHVNRHYDDAFVNEGATIGRTLAVRKPMRYQSTLRVSELQNPDAWTPVAGSRILQPVKS